MIEAGFSVIIDAAFLKARQRDLFKQLATECGVQFHIVDFQASDEELCRRIGQRQNDASEATIDVLHHQQRSAQPLSAEEQNFVIAINTESNDALKILLDNVDGFLQ